MCNWSAVYCHTTTVLNGLHNLTSHMIRCYHLTHFASTTYPYSLGAEIFTIKQLLLLFEWILTNFTIVKKKSTFSLFSAIWRVISWCHHTCSPISQVSDTGQQICSELFVWSHGPAVGCARTACWKGPGPCIDRGWYGVRSEKYNLIAQRCVGHRARCGPRPAHGETNTVLNLTPLMLIIANTCHTVGEGGG